MKREMIEKVIRSMMKYETVNIELLGVTEDERARELAVFIKRDIKEDMAQSAQETLEQSIKGIKLMNRKEINQVLEEVVRVADVDAIMKVVDHMESIAHKRLEELGNSCIEITKSQLVEQREEFKALLSDLKLVIENDITATKVNGVSKEVTLEDKLELIEEEWLMFKENLLEHLGVHL